MCATLPLDLNNATVGALIGAVVGAFAGVGVVRLTDHLRARYVARRTIPSFLRDLDALAVTRLQRVQRIIDDLQRQHSGPQAISKFETGIPFDTASLRWMTQQAFDKLSAEQRSSIAQIVFLLEGADMEVQHEIGYASSSHLARVFYEGALGPAGVEKLILNSAREAITTYPSA